MVAYNKFNQFVEDEANGAHDFDTHVYKVALSNSAPVATNNVFGDITEIAAGNGYTAGGTAVTFVSSVEASGVYRYKATGPVFTAAGGSIAPFRYVYLYNSTQTTPNKPLVSWFDYGSSITLAAGETFTVTFDATNGVFSKS